MFTVYTEEGGCVEGSKELGFGSSIAAGEVAVVTVANSLASG